MKKKYFILLFLIPFFLLPAIVLSQISSQQQFQNDKTDFDPKLMVHYSYQELENLSINYPDDYDQILYYHLLSYKITITDAENPFLKEFHLETFDITLYEAHRKLDIPVMMEFEKYGFILEIFPYDDLSSLTPLQVIYKNRLEE